MMDSALRRILRHWPFERMRLQDVAPDGLLGVLIITCEREGAYGAVAAFQVPSPAAPLGAQKFAALCDGQLGALYVSVADARERARILTEVRALIRAK
jgi:hypothetical protein